VAAIQPDTPAAVQQRVAALAARRGAAGAQVVLRRDGRLVLEHCLGLADVARQRLVTPGTTFNAYSITKTLTAAAVVALADAGRLDLDAPIGVAAGVEGLEAYGSVRETLLHRAGFRNPNPLRWIHPARSHDSFDEAAFVRARVEPLRRTRRRWARSGYSNVGYLLLGLAVERASGEPFVQAVHSRVIDPLRLAPDERLGFRIEKPECHAHGHLRRRGLLDLTLGLFADRPALLEGSPARWVQLRLHQVDGSAYGGLMANARGLARFGQAVIGIGEGMRPAVRRQLLDIVPGPGPCRSLGWFCGALGHHRWFAHAGGGLGAYGELRLYPQQGAVSVLLTNGPGLADARCLDDIDPAWIGD
jgi:CubicO group peptidase (beta-lactamase class C family)